LEEAARAPEPRPPRPPKRRAFGPLRALLVFLAFLGTQVVAAFLMGIAAAILNALGPKRALTEALADAMPAILLVSLALSGGAALLATRLLVGRPLRGVVGRRFGVQPATGHQILVGAAAGVLLGGLLLVVLLLVPPRAVETPLTRVAATRTGFWSLVVLALLIAPPVEEFVFRGVIYRGLRTRLPAGAAAILVTAVFTLLHLGELSHYWPGFGLIAMLGLVTLALRVRTGSLFPAVAAHFAYNACAMSLAHPW
jgi:membrane protease YdiL (CAAX protease family)